MTRHPPSSTLFPYTTLFRSTPFHAGNRPDARRRRGLRRLRPEDGSPGSGAAQGRRRRAGEEEGRGRSEEHTSELQSQSNLVCRLLLEKKKRGKLRKCNVALR